MNVMEHNRPPGRARRRSTKELKADAAALVLDTARCNDISESFFAALERGFVPQRRFANRDQARREIFAVIARYITQRFHSTLDYRTPTESEDLHHQQRLHQAGQNRCPANGGKPNQLLNAPHAPQPA